MTVWCLSERSRICVTGPAFSFAQGALADTLVVMENKLVAEWLSVLSASGQQGEVMAALYRNPEWVRSPRVAEVVLRSDVLWDGFDGLADTQKSWVIKTEDALFRVLPERSFVKLVSEPGSLVAAEAVLRSPAAAERLPSDVRRMFVSSRYPDIRLAVAVNRGFSRDERLEALFTVPEGVVDSSDAEMLYKQASEQRHFSRDFGRDLLELAPFARWVTCPIPKVRNIALRWNRNEDPSDRVVVSWDTLSAMVDSVSSGSGDTSTAGRGSRSWPSWAGQWFLLVSEMRFVTAPDGGPVPWDVVQKEAGLPDWTVSWRETVSRLRVAADSVSDSGKAASFRAKKLDQVSGVLPGVSVSGWAGPSSSGARSQLTLSGWVWLYGEYVSDSAVWVRVNEMVTAENARWSEGYRAGELSAAAVTNPLARGRVPAELVPVLVAHLIRWVPLGALLSAEPKGVLDWLLRFHPDADLVALDTAVREFPDASWDVLAAALT